MMVSVIIKGGAMKISKEKAAENRMALIKAASHLFRQHGIDGVGVAEISKAAGLTHGALYAHFESKEALAAEALAYGAKSNNAWMETLSTEHKPDLTAFLDYYVSQASRDGLEQGCVMAASASEIGRQDLAISRSFTDGYLDMVSLLEAALDKGKPKGDAHARALTMVASMVGTIAVARAVAKARPELSAQLLTEARKIFGELGGEKKK
jgi:TetR/AcrR family transcriptional repressor of nem operon